jgi:protoheme IX farnesyltransferase
VTKKYIVAYIFVYLVAVSALPVFGYAGYTFEVVMMSVGIIWLARGISGFTSKDDTLWAKKLFLFSLLVLLTFSVVLAISSLLP